MSIGAIAIAPYKQGYIQTKQYYKMQYLHNKNVFLDKI